MFWRNSPEKFQVCLLATALWTLTTFYQKFYLSYNLPKGSSRRKSKSCRRMRRPTADFENTVLTNITLSAGVSLISVWKSKWYQRYFLISSNIKPLDVSEKFCYSRCIFSLIVMFDMCWNTASRVYVFLFRTFRRVLQICGRRVWANWPNFTRNP